MRIFGIQSWVALPARDEERDPSFIHHGAEELPVIEGEGKWMRLIAGSLFGERSPVETLSEMFYADLILDADARVSIPTEHEERAVYIVEGEIALDREDGTFTDGQLLVLKLSARIRT